MTPDEKTVLQLLTRSPSGVMFRAEVMKGAVLALARRQLVRDPQAIGTALFTRITDEGKAAFQAAS